MNIYLINICVIILLLILIFYRYRSYVKKTNEWLAYLFNNNTSKADGIENNKVEIASIEKLTGFKFK